MLDYNPIISYIVFMKPHYPFIASKNYKGGTTTGCSTSHRIMPSSCYGPVLIPDLYRHLLGATVIEIWDQLLSKYIWL